MRSNALSRTIPTPGALVPFLARPVPSLTASAFSTLAQKLDPTQTAQRDLEEAPATTKGLPSLLALARRFRRVPLDNADVEARAAQGDGLAMLLVKGRQWHAAQEPMQTVSVSGKPGVAPCPRPVRCSPGWRPSWAVDRRPPS